MLNVGFNFGYENDLVYIAKKSAYFAINEFFTVASRAEMFIGDGKIDWVEVRCYLSVNICNGKYFCTDCEERRKFYATANGIISNDFVLSEVCYMRILICIEILT